jgi:hypothetical protein
MTKTKRTTVLLSLFGALLGATAIVVLTNPAQANQLLHGEYIVTQSTQVPAPAHIALKATKNGQISTQNLRCVLPNGLDSTSCWVAAYGLNLNVDLIHEGPYVGRIAVDFLPLEIWADNHGFDVISIETKAPVIQNAEAYWDQVFGHWVCALTQLDLALCDSYCAPEAGQVDARPATIGYNSPLNEPACEVSCDCANGNEDDQTWIDPPAVVPG